MVGGRMCKVVFLAEICFVVPGVLGHVIEYFMDGISAWLDSIVAFAALLGH